MKADVSPLTLLYFCPFSIPDPMRRQRTTPPDTYPVLLSVLATAGTCYPQFSGVIHQHDKRVKRELGRGNKSFVEDLRMKRLLKK